MDQVGGNNSELLKGAEFQIRELKSVLASRDALIARLQSSHGSLQRSLWSVRPDGSKINFRSLLIRFIHRVFFRLFPKSYLRRIYRVTECFDPVWYLESNPDVKAVGIDAWDHFYRYGFYEGRAPGKDFGPPPNLSEISHPSQSRGSERLNKSALKALSPARKTILLVSHDISRTGAPILLINLAAGLRKRYNLITIVLGGGSLEREFNKVSDVMIGPLDNHEQQDDSITGLVRLIKECTPIDCALVNSIVSTPVIKSLRANGIPVVHLIHEFASYTLPKDLFIESALHANIQVYCSRLILENMLGSNPMLAESRHAVIPQGQCILPVSSVNPLEKLRERARIDQALRPPGSPDNLVVVVMLGTVHYRKGVDLFMECAGIINRKKGKVPIRFVWFGAGFEPDVDEAYSVYLNDQLARAGISDCCTIVSETFLPEYVHECSDILFLSSRLDPLPLVAQDMMAIGKPVVCFSRTTGIAEYLESETDAKYGVVPYLDCETAAEVIMDLAGDSGLRARLGMAQCRVCEAEFNSDNYAETISGILEAESRTTVSQLGDIGIIQKSSLIDPDYFHPWGDCHHAETLSHVYVRSWARGNFRRKPRPGFHPGVYLELNPTVEGDPFAHYLVNGKPGGPWCFPLITQSSPVRPQINGLRLGLHLHLFYADMADDILGRIKSCRARPRLYISTGDLFSKEVIESSLAKLSLSAESVIVVPNRGRDLAPLFNDFGRRILDDCDVIGHIHSKKSLHLQDEPVTMAWTNFLYENLLGGSHPMMDVILSAMAGDRTLGMVFPDDPNVIGWSANREFAEELAGRMGISRTFLAEHFNFPVGSMFWARTDAIKAFIDLKLGLDDYPMEPLPADGSLLHAMERLFPFVAQSAGYRIAVTNVASISR